MKDHTPSRIEKTKEFFALYDSVSGYKDTDQQELQRQAFILGITENQIREHKRKRIAKLVIEF